LVILCTKFYTELSSHHLYKGMMYAPLCKDRNYMAGLYVGETH